MIAILTPVLTLTGLGLIFGAALAYASRRFAVIEDPKLAALITALPGSNCGACGFAGCRAFAEMIKSGKAEPGGCAVGGDEAAERIAKIMDIEHKKKVRKKAVIHCGASWEQKDKRGNYRGTKTCAAVQLVGGGELGCTYGCSGYGDCAAACPFDALVMINGLPHVIYEKCTGCGKCVIACPRRIISLEAPVRDEEYVTVACSSRDKGPVVKSYCTVGCIACMICQKASPHGEFVVEDNLAHVEYKSATPQSPWEEIIRKCPTSCIVALK